MDNRPVFGKKEVGASYQERRGAYLVLPSSDGEKILVVQAPNGAYFLPGGEIEPGESQTTTIHRELLEEAGYQVTLADYLGEAVDYFYSRYRDTYYYHPAYFYSASQGEAVQAPIEDFNQLEWCTAPEALTKLKRGSHRWAVVQWQSQIRK